MSKKPKKTDSKKPQQRLSYESRKELVEQSISEQLGEIQRILIEWARDYEFQGIQIRTTGYVEEKKTKFEIEITRHSQ